jgi:putative colanic acid biosynthesis acetyltransferase WcaF
MKVKSTLISPVFNIKNKLYRLAWVFIYAFFFKYSPTHFFKYRVFLLKVFGADVRFTSRIYSKAIIWSPRNLTIGHLSTIGPDVRLYNQAPVTIGDYVIISQGSHICASTHDYNDPLHPLVLRPVVIEDHVWICADAFVGPGVTLNEGSVVGARAAIFKNSQPWSVYSGNPAQLIKQRENFTHGKT